jgi:hypothetical protein
MLVVRGVFMKAYNVLFSCLILTITLNVYADDVFYLCEPLATGGIDYDSEAGWQGKLHPIHAYDGGIEKSRYSVKIGDSGSTWKVLNSTFSEDLETYKGGNKIGIYYGLNESGRFEFNQERLQFTYARTGSAIIRNLESEYSNLPTLYVQIGKCFPL